uniref:Uncharacterized protein n=1 Tax=Brassica campestris TaxID=3711 RepID=A0A3P6BBJ3_BRACM|nr:unnamed protein product [Brassica rapa]
MKTTLSTKTTNIIPANFFTLLADLKASLCLRSDWFRSNGLASYSAQLFSFGDIIAPNGVRVVLWQCKWNINALLAGHLFLNATYATHFYFDNQSGVRASSMSQNLQR